MENETVLAITGKVPSSVAVEEIAPGRFLAAWSASNETFLVELGEDGAAAGSVRRIRKDRGNLVAGDSDSMDSPKTFWPSSERSSICAEDLELVSLGNDSAALVMIERPGDNTPGGVYAALFSPLSDIDPPVMRIGAAGIYASSIAAQECAEGLIAAWHEGTPNSSEIVTARLAVKPFGVEKTSRFAAGGAASNPSLAGSGQGALIAWSETVHDGEVPASLIKVGVLSPKLELQSVREVAKGRFLDPDPHLSRGNDQIGLVFRDDADKDGKPEFYFALIESTGKTSLEPKRISQADGRRGPSLIYDAPVFVSAAIRSFQRNLLVGINRFDKKGVKLGGEFQVYADKTDFVRVDLASSDDGILMIYAEDRRDSGRVLASKIRCGDPL